MSFTAITCESQAPAFEGWPHCCVLNESPTKCAAYSYNAHPKLEYFHTRVSGGQPRKELYCCPDDPAIGAVGPLCFDGDDEFGLRLQPTPARAPAGVHFRRRNFNRFDAPTHDEPFHDFTMSTDGAARAPLSFEADDVPALAVASRHPHREPPVGPDLLC